MRKSEAEHLLEHLDKSYKGPLQLQVVNLEQVSGGAFRVPEGEKPFFVVGLKAEASEGEIKRQVAGKRKKVMAWNEAEQRWLVQTVEAWEVLRTQRSQLLEELFVYDTRRREFVSLEEFHLPRGSS